jgi:hypothetical protein
VNKGIVQVALFLAEWNPADFLLPSGTTCTNVVPGELCSNRNEEFVCIAEIEKLNFAAFQR